MRNHIHQHGTMASRYSTTELKRRDTKRWYRNLKAQMRAGEWQDKTPGLWGVSWFRRFWVAFVKTFRKYALLD